MIEDVLATLAEEGFVVSNTFQLEDGARARAGGAPSRESLFGSDKWQVYLRNSRDTRTGNGRGETMEAALLAARRAAGEKRASVASVATDTPPQPYKPISKRPPLVRLGSASDEGDPSDLF